jgi:8-oxo-dGTP pyrophosphatase MutT (NUDIX family)
VGVTALRDAATVIVLRPAATSFEVLLLRRRTGASFMARACVFPGGGLEPGEDARAAAARELAEEAAVRIDTAALVPWSHWITPSIEPKRFSARFFVTELPPGQVPQFDATETVDQVWVTPDDALARSKELALPPPQVRTFWELAQYKTIAEVLAAAKKRADEPHPIMPRLSPTNGGPCLLLPWDPDYTITGTGEATPLAYVPTWATGPSRFYMQDGTWKHVVAPKV